MAATSLDRNTKKRGPIRQRNPIPVAAASTGAAAIPIGTMVSTATPSVGAVRSAATATHVVQGVACQAVDFANGDTKIIVEQGIFLMGNDGSVTAANVGALCLVIDNQTVGMVQAANIGAGYVEEVDAEGVWVNMTQAKIAAA